MAQMSEAQQRLVVQTAKELRAAIDERNRTTADCIAEYDEAIRDGDEKQIEAKGLMMLVMVGLADPTRAVLQRYSQVAELLRASEAAA